MALHDLVLSLLVGNSIPVSEVVSGVEKVRVEIAPAYQFQRADGTVSWPVVVPYTTDTGTLTIPGLAELDSAGEKVIWQLRTVFLGRGDQVVGGGESVAFQIPDGAAVTLNYPADITLRDVVLPPEYGPTWAQQAEASAVAAREAADEAALIDANTVSSGTVVGDALILSRTNGSSFSAGNVRGPQGLQGLPGVNAVDNDTAVATYLSSPGSASDKALSAVGRGATYVRDIRTFLQGSETLDRTNTVLMTTIVQRAMDALNVEYMAQSGALGVRGFQIYFPNGDYRVRGLVPRAGVGIVGESTVNCNFRPYGAQGFWGQAAQADSSVTSTASLVIDSWPTSFDLVNTGSKVMYVGTTSAVSTSTGTLVPAGGRITWPARTPAYAITASAGNTTTARYYSYDDCRFDTHTVDGAAQTSASYSTSIKGYFMQFMRRSHWNKVRVLNCWATGFGVDHLQGATFTDCIANGNGRGIIELGIDPYTTSGGSGFGIGSGGSPDESVRIINCTADNNGMHGFFTEKQNAVPYYSTGFTMIGCHAKGNWIGFRDCGSTGAVISGCHFIGNRYCGVSIDKTILATNGGVDGRISGCQIRGNGTDPKTYVAAGIVIGASALGGYSIVDNEIAGNLGHGIYSITGETVGARMNICDNRVHDNTGWGVRFGASMPKLRLNRNDLWGNTSGDIAFAGTGVTSANVVFEGNNADGGVLLEHTLTGISNTGNHFTPGAVTALSVTSVTRTSVSLSWVISSTTPGLTDFSVQYRAGSSGGWTTFAHTASTTQAITVTGLTQDTQYQFQVAAIISGVTGPYAGPAVATPSWPLVIADYFAGADTTNISGRLATAGPNQSVAWSVVGSGTVGIVSNYAKTLTGTTTYTAGILESGYADGKIDVLVGAVKNSGGTDFSTRRFRAVFRFTDISNHLFITATTDGKWSLGKVVGGTTTILAATTADAVNGDVLTAEFLGTSVKFSVNGVQVASVTETAQQTATKVGFAGIFGTDASSKSAGIRVYV